MSLSLKRTTAFLTLIAFCFTSNGQAQIIAPAPKTEAETALPLIVEQLKIPAQLGKLEESYLASPESPVVVILQDAHSIPAAQHSLYKLIEHFGEKYGVKHVALEGASSKLDAQIFRSFPDQKALREVMEPFAARGELSGAVAAAMFSNISGVEYHGIEDWKLYQESIALYAAAMEKAPELLKQVEGRRQRVEGEKRKVYSKELLEVDRALDDFYNDRKELMAVLKQLAKVKKPEAGSEIALLIEGTQGTHGSDLETEVRQIVEQMKKRLETQPRFNQIYQQFQTSQISAQEFASFLHETAGTSFSKPLSLLIKNHQTLREMQGTKFFESFEAYSQSVKEQLFRNDEERRLDGETRELQRLEKWVRLELSREEWKEFKGRKVTKSQGHKAQTEFYENAEKREQAFISNLKAFTCDIATCDFVTSNSLLIAGGFHAQALTQKFREQKISYALVTPQIASIPENDSYQAHMRGDVSWKNYFRIQKGRVNLYEAFVRAIRDKFQDPAILKSWRDQMIRDLAAQNKIEKAGDYTRFIDELSASPIQKIERFAAGLRRLESQHQLTEQNIMNLAAPSMSLSPYAGVLPLAPRQEIRIFPIYKTADFAGRSEIRTYSDSELKDPAKTALQVLKNKKLEAMIVKRLISNWETLGLGGDKVIPIIDLLKAHADDSARAFQEIVSQFPELADSNSDFAVRVMQNGKARYQSVSQKILPFVKGPVVIDIGGSRGKFLSELIKDRPDIKLAIATDVRKVEKVPSDERIQVKLQPAGFDTGLEDQSVDTVIISLTLHHIDREIREKLLPHVQRILKPGGRLIVIEDTFPETANATDLNDYGKELLQLSREERFQMVMFFDWFSNSVVVGNSLIPGRSDTEMSYTFESIESWKHMFTEELAMQLEYLETIGTKKGDESPVNFPKAILVFKNELSMRQPQFKNYESFNRTESRHLFTIQRNVAQLDEQELLQYVLNPDNSEELVFAVAGEAEDEDVLHLVQDAFELEIWLRVLEQDLDFEALQLNEDLAPQIAGISISRLDPRLLKSTASIQRLKPFWNSLKTMKFESARAEVRTEKKNDDPNAEFDFVAETHPKLSRIKKRAIKILLELPEAPQLQRYKTWDFFVRYISGKTRLSEALQIAWVSGEIRRTVESEEAMSPQTKEAALKAARGLFWLADNHLRNEVRGSIENAEEVIRLLEEKILLMFQQAAPQKKKLSLEMSTQIAQVAYASKKSTNPEYVEFEGMIEDMANGKVGLGLLLAMAFSDIPEKMREKAAAELSKIAPNRIFYYGYLLSDPIFRKNYRKQYRQILDFLMDEPDDETLKMRQSALRVALPTLYPEDQAIVVRQLKKINKDHFDLLPYLSVKEQSVLLKRLEDAPLDHIGKIFPYLVQNHHPVGSLIARAVSAFFDDDFDAYLMIGDLYPYFELSLQTDILREIQNRIDPQNPLFYASMYALTKIYKAAKQQEKQTLTLKAPLDLMPIDTTAFDLADKLEYKWTLSLNMRPDADHDSENQYKSIEVSLRIYPPPSPDKNHVIFSVSDPVTLEEYYGSNHSMQAFETQIAMQNFLKVFLQYIQSEAPTNPFFEELSKATIFFHSLPQSAVEKINGQQWSNATTSHFSQAIALLKALKNSPKIFQPKKIVIKPYKNGQALTIEEAILALEKLSLSEDAKNSLFKLTRKANLLTVEIHKRSEIRMRAEGRAKMNRAERIKQLRGYVAQLPSGQDPTVRNIAAISNGVETMDSINKLMRYHKISYEESRMVKTVKTREEWIVLLRKFAAKVPAIKPANAAAVAKASKRELTEKQIKEAFRVHAIDENEVGMVNDSASYAQVGGREDWIIYLKEWVQKLPKGEAPTVVNVARISKGALTPESIRFAMWHHKIEFKEANMVSGPQGGGRKAGEQQKLLQIVGAIVKGQSLTFDQAFLIKIKALKLGAEELGNLLIKEARWVSFESSLISPKNAEAFIDWLKKFMDAELQERKETAAIVLDIPGQEKNLDAAAIQNYAQFILVTDRMQPEKLKIKGFQLISNVPKRKPKVVDTATVAVLTDREGLKEMGRNSFGFGVLLATDSEADKDPALTALANLTGAILGITLSRESTSKSDLNAAAERLKGKLTAQLLKHGLLTESQVQALFRMKNGTLEINRAELRILIEAFAQRATAIAA